MGQQSTILEHGRIVRRACELVGLQPLAVRLGVPRAMVQAWLAGTAALPPRAFRTLLYILKKADPGFRLRDDEPAELAERVGFEPTIRY